MAIVIENVTIDFAGATARGEAHDYMVRINMNAPIASFKHEPTNGLAACLRSAADAIEAAKEEETTRLQRSVPTGDEAGGGPCSCDRCKQGGGG